jgi:hypothetical protein
VCSSKSSPVAGELNNGNELEGRVQDVGQDVDGRKAIAFHRDYP